MRTIALLSSHSIYLEGEDEQVPEQLVMYDVYGAYSGVPGALLRLREADIVSVAGLTVASLGQEYCRIGAVHSMKRQEARVSGIVDVPDISPEQAVLHTNGVTPIKQADTQNAPGCYIVGVEVRADHSWIATCTCDRQDSACVHAAALLYQWISHPATFQSTTIPSAAHLSSAKDSDAVRAPHSQEDPPMPSTVQDSQAESVGQNPQKGRDITPAVSMQRSAVHFNASTSRITGHAGTIAEMLASLSLSELRGIAREYDITTVGLNKLQLVEAITNMLQQAEVVRRIAATLEKSQRQLLAALTLAGGTMSDEDLRGLCERFSLGSPGQLQTMLLALSSKAFILRSSLNASLQQRMGLSGASLDLHWQVPLEVRRALHVAVPVTTFAVESSGNGNKDALNVQWAEQYTLLADLLLIARALDGYLVEREERRDSRRGPIYRVPSPAPGTANRVGISSPIPRKDGDPGASDGSMLIPAPGDMPEPSLLESLQAATMNRYSLGFLRFAVRLLRMAEIVYPGDTSTPCLRVLPNAAQLLLGPGRADVLRELFSHWLKQTSYAELLDLNDEGVRLCCRCTPSGQPALRAGELEAENSEARQTLTALIAQAPRDRWINFPSFARFIYRLNPYFLQRRQRHFSSPHWWMEQEEGRPLRPAQLPEWLRAEGHYLARLIQGPLHWWGIADIVLAPDDRLLAFRLAPTAGVLLNGIPETNSLRTTVSTINGALTENSSGGGIHLAPTITVSEESKLLLPSIPENWEVIELIERFTEICGVQAGQLCYRLSAASLSAALSRGQSPAPLLELLRNAGAPAYGESTAIKQWLAQLESRIANYGRIRLYSDATLLEVADSAVLRELAAVTSINDAIVRPAHPTLMIIKKQGAEGLIDELKRRGQAPLTHDEAG
ncbi:MAG TPA: Rho termination factor N-terminal domain-containing protein [Ktedonobacteraceae bacterium]|nr:Rho termination factor N-terminal domain-containing protein [Ktedonobacteraceae bacterium]